MTTLEKVLQRALDDAKTYGYHLNPDTEFLKNLIEGLKLNEERYGYPSCPCRLASGKIDFDRDILCPCDYRDPDVEEYGSCYCALYLRKDVFEGKTAILPIPERRPLEKRVRAYGTPERSLSTKDLEDFAQVPNTFKRIELKLWYCKQCGYVVFREEPPYICPICKAKREMFAVVEKLSYD